MITKKWIKYIACLDSIPIIWDHPCVTIILATMLIWTPFSPSMSTFCFRINPCSQNSVKLRFTNIQGLCSNFFAWDPFVESSSLDILAVCETNLQHPIGSSNFSVRTYLPFVQKDSFTHMHGLTVHVTEGLPFVC